MHSFDFETIHHEGQDVGRASKAKQVDELDSSGILVHWCEFLGHHFQQQTNKQTNKQTLGQKHTSITYQFTIAPPSAHFGPMMATLIIDLVLSGW